LITTSPGTAYNGRNVKDKAIFRANSPQKTGLKVEMWPIERMRAKWGSCFKAGGQAMGRGAGRSISGTNILNSICSVPIQGC
jgi:hypothetical protein